MGTDGSGGALIPSFLLQLRIDDELFGRGAGVPDIEGQETKYRENAGRQLGSPRLPLESVTKCSSRIEKLAIWQDPNFSLCASRRASAKRDICSLSCPW